MLLVAQASSPIDREALDKQCTTEYSYDCNYPLYDTHTGDHCGKGLPVATSEVKGTCVLANLAHAEDYLSPSGQWESLPTPNEGTDLDGTAAQESNLTGNPTVQTAPAVDGTVYNGSFYPIQTPETLPADETANINTYGAPSTGQLDSQSLLSPEPNYISPGNDQIFDGSVQPQVPTLGQFSGPVFNETTGQWEGGYPGLPGEEGYQNELSSPLTQGQLAQPDNSGLVFDEQNNLAYPQSTPAQSYAYPTTEQQQAYTYPPSPSTQIPQFQQSELYQQQTPEEYQPQPGETYYVNAQGNLTQGDPYSPTVNSLQASGMVGQSTFPTQAISGSSFGTPQQAPSDIQVTPASSQGLFLTTVESYYSNLLSRF